MQCEHVKRLNPIRSLGHINDHINPITLFSVHVNTTFGFVNQNEFIPMEAKSVHVNVATNSIWHILHALVTQACVMGQAFSVNLYAQIITQYVLQFIHFSFFCFFFFWLLLCTSVYFYITYSSLIRTFIYLCATWNICYCHSFFQFKKSTDLFSLSVLFLK